MCVLSGYSDYSSVFDVIPAGFNSAMMGLMPGMAGLPGPMGAMPGAMNPLGQMACLRPGGCPSLCAAAVAAAAAHYVSWLMSASGLYPAAARIPCCCCSLCFMVDVCNRLVLSCSSHPQLDQLQQYTPESFSSCMRIPESAQLGFA
jgi:hypothetical protein